MKSTQYIQYVLAAKDVEIINGCEISITGMSYKHQLWNDYCWCPNFKNFGVAVPTRNGKTQVPVPTQHIQKTGILARKKIID